MAYCVFFMLGRKLLKSYDFSLFCARLKSEMLRFLKVREICVYATTSFY